MLPEASRMWGLPDLPRLLYHFEYVGTSGFDRERSSRLRAVAPAHVKTGNNTTGEREVALAAA